MIVIIGAGISGLSLSYFLSSCGIRNTVIDMRKKIGTKNRSTGLVSGRIMKILDFLKQNEEKIIIERFKRAIFWYNFNKIFEIKNSREMLLFKYPILERELLRNIDSSFSSFLLGERVVDVNLEKNLLKTNRRALKFDFLVDASGTHSFLANRYRLFKFKQIFNSFEVLGETKSEYRDVNIFLGHKISKNKFGWLINAGEKSLIGLIDVYLSREKFKRFASNFGIKRIFYEYSHPILFCKLKKHVLKDALVIGEAAGFIKPFSLGGIVYGVISSFLAFKAISNNDLEWYEKKVRDVFRMSLLIGEVINKFIRKESLLKIICFLNVHRLLQKIDPDFLY